MITKAQIRKLIQTASRARRRAHAPYSKFHVGSAVLGGSGKLYGGCNVENASYGLTVCAERTAVFNAVAAGEKKIRALAVLFHSTRLASPCGAGRQVMREFGKSMPVVLANLRGGYRVRTVDDLLPDSFGPEDL